MTALAVALFAGLGAVARYAIDRRTPKPRGFPLGILLINVTGSLLLGLATGWHERGALSGEWFAALGAGFAGGYTTLSTWAWDTEQLRCDRASGLAALNVALSVAACTAAAGAGLALAAA